MDVEMIRSYCLSLKDTSEEIKWEDNLCFMIHKKIYVIVSLDNGKVSFKCDPEVFDELTARDGIMQAAHFAKRQWVSLLSSDVLSAVELKQWISKSRNLVIQKLPKKVQALYI
jgi:predicted DNA-binding protein (MmcQ/YjbR family)